MKPAFLVSLHPMQFVLSLLLAFAVGYWRGRRSHRSTNG